MGKIKKILENELIGGTQSTDIYPITSTKAVYDTGNKVLDDYIQHLKKTSTFAGIATPTTNPGTPDGPVFYIATKVGTYSNFDGISVAEGEAVILQWNDGAWAKKTTGLATEQEIIYDVSARNSGVAFESLSALLSSSNLSTLIPTSVRHGGMSIKFIQGSVPNSDNKYAQYRYTNTDATINSKFTNVANWQGVDDIIVANSKNLITSNAAFNGIKVVSDELNGEENKTLLSKSNDALTRPGYIVYKPIDGIWRYVYDDTASGRCTIPFKVYEGDRIVINTEKQGSVNPQLSVFFCKDAESVIGYNYKKITNDVFRYFEFVATEVGYVVINFIYLGATDIISFSRKDNPIYATKDYAKDLYITYVGNPGILDSHKYYRHDNNVYMEQYNYSVLGNGVSLKAVCGLMPSDLNNLQGILYFYAEYNPVRIGVSYDNGSGKVSLSYDSILGCYKLDLDNIDKTQELYIYFTAEGTRSGNANTRQISIENIHITNKPWYGESLVKPNELVGIYGKDDYHFNVNSNRTLQQVINEIKDGGTLYIDNGDYIIPDTIYIDHPINIIGVGTVRLLGGKLIKSATPIEGYNDVYFIQVGTDELGYAYGNIWQDGIASLPIQEDEWGYLNNRTYRLPSTRLAPVNSLDAVKESSIPCYFKNGNTFYFRTIANSDLSVNPIVINKHNDSHGYANDTTLSIWYNSNKSYITNISVLYEDINIFKSECTLTRVKGLCTNSQNSLNIAKQNIKAVLIECEFGGSNGDGMHSGSGWQFDSNAICDIEYHNCWFHDCNDGVSSHSGNIKTIHRFFDCIFSHNSVSGSSPVNAKEFYSNCIFLKNSPNGSRGALQIVSVDGQCDVTCVNCIAIDNGGCAWCVQAEQKSTLNLYGCKAIISQGVENVAFAYKKFQSTAGYINAFGCTNNYPQDKQSSLSGQGEIKIVGETVLVNS